MGHYAFYKEDDTWKYVKYDGLMELVAAAAAMPSSPSEAAVCTRYKLNGVRWWWMGMTDKDAVEDVNLLPADLRAMLVIWSLDQLLE
ncbi:hypothetical protein PP756_gp22 [Pseudomonas phage VB_PaeP_VL1]|uniref:Uncharacterized protein n=1 Tax=Pseudomonas phage VB_PaeP_VL1 TaxID=2894395 RepID=A0AAE8YZ02_9CAUD|nr:hypothetical protein PP756_gp22 [Pseudomonas phage VB_PaeP_VL1]UGV19818.1 hypothetical protein vBPaePVL1_22 [Pseudomonas phage VB_PaeP_VL1]